MSGHLCRLYSNTTVKKPECQSQQEKFDEFMENNQQFYTNDICSGQYQYDTKSFPFI